MEAENLKGLIKNTHSMLRTEFGGMIGPLDEKSLGAVDERRIDLTPESLASMIDHTLLKPEASESHLKTVCDEAKEFKFKTVCVNSSNIPFVAERLKGSGVLPISVVGFPLGAMMTEAKVYETKLAIKEGAKEIDTVINIGRLRSADLKFVFEDIREVVKAAKSIPVKVIIETALLDTKEKIMASILSLSAGARFVKTSTGFAGGGATEEDLRLIRMCVGDKAKIKASGGIKTYDDAIRMIKASADRIGCSSSVSIIQGSKKSA